MVQLDRQNLKDPIICPPKTEDMHLTPNSFLASKQKRGGKSRGATRGLNKHLSTLHSRSIVLNLSLPSIKQKIDQNNKSNVLLVAYTSVTPWIFGHFLGVTVKYTSIYNDRCWAHLGTFASFMFWSSSPLSPVSWHLNCGSNSSARPEWTSTVDLCDPKGEANFPKSIHGKIHTYTYRIYQLNVGFMISSIWVFQIVWALYQRKTAMIAPWKIDPSWSKQLVPNYCWWPKSGEKTHLGWC